MCCQHDQRRGAARVVRGRMRAAAQSMHGHLRARRARPSSAVSRHWHGHEQPKLVRDDLAAGGARRRFARRARQETRTCCASAGADQCPISRRSSPPARRARRPDERPHRPHPRYHPAPAGAAAPTGSQACILHACRGRRGTRGPPAAATRGNKPPLPPVRAAPASEPRPRRTWPGRARSRAA